MSRFLLLAQQHLKILSCFYCGCHDIITAVSGEIVQNLINQLLAGTTEYRDGGVVVQHPPTAAQTRAAKVVSELNNQNIANQQILVNQQQQITDLLNDLQMLNARDTEYRAVISNLQLEVTNLVLKLKEAEHALTVDNTVATSTSHTTHAATTAVAEPGPTTVSST